MDPNEPSGAQAPLPWERTQRRPSRRIPHLVLVWSLDEPDRLGEAIPVAATISLGRGGPLDDDPAPRAALHRMRPGTTEARPPIPVIPTTCTAARCVPARAASVRARRGAA